MNKEEKYRYKLDMKITTVNKKGLFKGHDAEVEIESVINPLDIRHPLLIRTLTNFYQTQFKLPIFLLTINSAIQIPQ